MSTVADLPSSALDTATWTRAHDRLVEDLRELIRIPSINPPPVEAPDGERRAADWIAAALADAGLRPEILEMVPGRGSVAARLRGDGSGGEPLLLLGHLDVVPAAPELWTHDPFAGDVADGYVWGRGAVDMKNLVAMELGVVRLLADEARAAGRDPASDPVPGLTRDILFASTADEEAGGLNGIGWIVQERPELLRAAAAINESGAVATSFGGRRFYPIGVAEKGYAVYRLTVHGTWGHGSMPRDDNAAVRAARAVTRLAVQGPPRLTPVMRTFLGGVADHVEGEEARLLRALASDDPRLGEAALDAVCDAMPARVVRALLRDTISPNIVHAGVKYNVIPGEATIELDCRVLPGTTEEAMRDVVVDRLGEDLATHVDVELVIHAPPVDAPTDSELYRTMERTIIDHDPDGIPLPFMVPFATDAKHTAALEIPTYGFSPLRLDPDEPFMERFHGVDERVGTEALRWGLPVLYDVVRRFCG
ncbi:MAG TPA: M20/M25/M40 family metallo-hydrolase [Candidatus Limnocylindrales bacterium]|nr:M20/M25/M40 family metallo-hydrolase [Candidatus Limnocylindrales bacterium]